MSTGADCQITEREPGKWFLRLQEWPYGESPNYTEDGPFPSEDAAIAFLDANYANPGGWSTLPYKEETR